MSERTTSRMVGATLLGGLAGAGLALLLAPRSGKGTREKIHQNVDNIKQTAAEKLEHTKENAREMKGRLAEATRRTGKKAEAELDQLPTNKLKDRQKEL